MNPIVLASLQSAIQEIRSALPDAPVVEPRVRRRSRLVNSARLATAGALHRIANRLEAPTAHAQYG
jgi:hypothetical protein